MNDLKGIIEDCNKSDLVSDKIIKKIKEKIKKLDKEIANYEKNGMKPKTPKLSDYKAGLNNNEGE